MKKPNCLFIVVALLFAAGLLPGLSQINEEKSFKGITHRGDPPYLLESGWIPLLNGRDMHGWEYVHGLYEIQIVNSYGKDSLNPTNTCGSIYDFEQKVNDEYVGGVSPLVRAERPAGHWQSYHILFKAPRFDNEGKKISNAKFLRVLQNGVVIHENVERKASTHASMKIKEAAENPLMLQLSSCNR